MSDIRLQDLLIQRFGQSPDVPAELQDNAFLTAFAARGSCRSFGAEPPADHLLHTIAAVALAAPSKSDLQQRNILIVKDPGKTEKMRTLLAAQEWIAAAPAFVVFLADNRRQRQIQDWHSEPFPNDHLDAFFNASLDAGIALHAFITAANAAGLGCCPISTIRNHMNDVRDLFDLPDQVFAVAALAVGYPATEPAVSARLSLDATVHTDRFRATTRADINEYDERRKAGTDAPLWSLAKARMYARAQRSDFGAFIRRIGFRTD
ncbi:nitroreductase family protein [uncultured Roseobacter sp.]|uniref:nitroreductase family protein n=1 Tax=uncultured Roseobacter sp. TaxID=114847 RepID=UPI002605AE0C|nr:nitroreductase family protein [uncultured Roseobacter sp.]